MNQSGSRECNFEKDYKLFEFQNEVMLMRCSFGLNLLIKGIKWTSRNWNLGHEAFENSTSHGICLELLVRQTPNLNKY
jgi:hypothetical protein